jgi:hypothetical protein
VDALEKKGAELSPPEKQQFIDASTQLKSLQHQRELILARTGDEYVLDPPKTDAPKKEPTKPDPQKAPTPATNP